MSSFISNSDAQPAWRRFFGYLAGTVVAIVGVLYLFTVVVDPWDGLPLSPPLDRAPVTANQRFAYPALARSARFDSAIFGTSTSRLLRPEALNAAFQGRFANLAMNDATPWEQTQLMHVFLRAHPQARTLVLGLDVRWCQTGEAIPRLTPRAFPEWLYQDNRWPGYREMLNMFAIQEAGKEFGVLTGFKRLDQGRDGYTVFVPPDDRYDREKAQAHLRGDGMMIPPGSPVGDPATWIYSAFEELRPILAELPSRTAVILYFVPYHGLSIPPAGHPAFEVWAECKRRAVVLARERNGVVVADFMRVNPITRDDDLYWDSRHYRVGVADRVARDLAAVGRGETGEDYEILGGGGR